MLFVNMSLQVFDCAITFAIGNITRWKLSFRLQGSFMGMETLNIYKLKQ